MLNDLLQLVGWLVAYCILLALGIGWLILMDRWNK